MLRTGATGDSVGVRFLPIGRIPYDDNDSGDDDDFDPWSRFSC